MILFYLKPFSTFFIAEENETRTGKVKPNSKNANLDPKQTKKKTHELALSSNKMKNLTIKITMKEKSEKKD